MTHLEMFKNLPHLNYRKEVIEDWGYTPSLYHFDTKWYVSWIHCEEGNTLLEYQGNTPEEAIEKAYNYYKGDIGLSTFKIGDKVKIITPYHIHEGEIGIITKVSGDVYDVILDIKLNYGCTVHEDNITLI